MLGRSPRVDETLRQFFCNLIRYTVLTFTVLAVLSQFGIQTASLLAVFGAGALAIGLALQGTLSNIAAGVMLLIFRPFKVGDYVETAGHAGTVKALSLFVTELATPDNVWRRHYSKNLLRGVVLAATLAATLPCVARAQPGVAADFVRDLGQQANAVLRSKDKSLAEREAALDKLLKDRFDLNLIGRFSLGRYWRQASEDQRRDYLQRFSAYVVRSYASKLGGYAGERLVIVSEQPLKNKKDVYVNTRINRPSGPPIKTSWRVRMVNSRTRIIDVVVEGISLAVTYRDQFSAVIRKNGMEGLLEVLRARTDKAPATASAR
jgi:ABC-type transporter MlaC component